MNNKLIRELAEQARDYVRKHVDECKHYGYYMEHNEYELQFEEKFAELIVRECSRHIEDTFDFCGDEIITAESVLKHFGVEKVSDE